MGGVSFSRRSTGIRAIGITRRIRRLLSFSRSTTFGYISLEERAQSVRAAIEAAPPRSSDLGDRLVRELRHREIREQFLGLDQLERTAAYLGLTDPEVRAAMEDGPVQLEPRRPGAAPTLAPFIDPERVREQVSARAEARDPERAAELRDLEQLIRTYRTVLASAHGAVLEATV